MSKRRNRRKDLIPYTGLPHTQYVVRRYFQFHISRGNSANKKKSLLSSWFYDDFKQLDIATVLEYF